MTDLPYPGPLSGQSHQIWPDDRSRSLMVFFGARDLAPGQFNFVQISRDLPATRIFLNNGSNDWYLGGIPGLAADLPGLSDWLAAWARAMNVRRGGDGGGLDGGLGRDAAWRGAGGARGLTCGCWRFPPMPGCWHRCRAAPNITWGRARRPTPIWPR